MANVNLSSLHSFLERKSTKTKSGTTIVSYDYDQGNDGPILCMVHGYPQSSYMWRHVAAAWKDHASLFIPELPGYGISSTPPSPNKAEIGASLLEALQSNFKNGSKRPIIWCSHDRGARVGHRVLASGVAGSEKIIAAMFMDIVPTREQWRSFSNPQAAVGYFHWPFLATSFAPDLILAMGGDVYARAIFEKSGGSSETGKAKLYENGAVDHYIDQFKKEETIRGSCADYADGSVAESKAQDDDQAAGRKVKVPLLVLYSADYLGRMHDVSASWKPYTDAELKCVGIPDGIGHYLPESAPEMVSEQVLAWIKKTAS